MVLAPGAVAAGAVAAGSELHTAVRLAKQAVELGNYGAFLKNGLGCSTIVLRRRVQLHFKVSPMTP